MRPTISVVINTLNEERNLGNALSSVYKWADEILVVDMHSEDRTVEIAEQYGAKVYMHPKMNFSEPAREFAIGKASGEWVLILDADEMVPKELSVKLIQLATEHSADAFNIPRLNYVLGEPMFYTGFGPDQDTAIRFFRKEMVILCSRIHRFISALPDARVKTLPYEDNLAIIHFSYTDIIQIIDKFNRYTTIEAQQAFELGEKANTVRALLHVFWEFTNRYVRKKGYRDGWRGLYFSGFMSSYRWITYGKLQELHSNGRKEEIVEGYRRVAHGIAASYLPNVFAAKNNREE